MQTMSVWIFCGLLLCGQIGAQGVPGRVSDLVPSGGAAHSSPRNLARFGSRTVFGRWSLAEGEEPWWTEGTSAGTTLLADLFPGPAGSQPRGWVELGGSLYFRASSETFDGLYRSDGTATGTRMIAQLGREDIGWERVVAVAGLLFLAARDTVTSSYVLWRSDGTEAGTWKLILPEPTAGVTTVPVALGSLVVFGLQDAAHGNELWASDGTTMWLVQDAVPGPGSGLLTDLQASAVVNGVLVFDNADDPHGREVWRTDGTSTGTGLLRDIYPGPPTCFVGLPAFTTWQGAAYFTAQDPGHGAELWRTDGTAAGTNLVADVVPGTGQYGPRSITAAAQGVFFLAPSATGLGLYRSDGTAAGTTLVRALPWETNYGALHMGAVGAQVFFPALSGNGGVDLWRSDGTSAGTMPIALPGGAFQYVYELIDGGGFLLFAAIHPVHGYELFRSDGTVAGTTVLRDYGGGGDTRPDGLTWIGRRMYFAADTPVHGRELWRTDGTGPGTTLVGDLAPGIESADPTELTAVGDSLFFVAHTGVFTPWGLWRCDSSNGGATLVTDRFAGMRLATIFALTDLRGTLVFAGSTGASGTLLFRSDGTAVGTQPIQAASENWIHNPTSLQLTPMDGVLYFQGERSSTGNELWRTDGTPAGTWMVTEIVPGTGGTTISGATPMNGVLYFAATTPAAGAELWRSDGTAAGTWLVNDLRPGPGGSDPSSLVAIDGLLYFAADDGIHGREVWRSDGTAPGTVLLRDLAPGPESAAPSLLTAFGDRLLFAAQLPGTGCEPWASNGTAAGTFLLRDLLPGIRSGIQPTRGSFFFAPPGATRALVVGSDGTHGREIWTTDGAVLGAAPHADIAPGPFSSNPGSASAQGVFGLRPTLAYGAGRIWFEADDSVTGRELWSMPSMAAAVPFGSECAPAGTPAPQLAGAGGAPTVGNAGFMLAVGRARPNAAALLFLGVDPGSTPIPGTPCVLTLAATGITEVRVMFTDATGRTLFPVPVPVDPFLDGTLAYAQVLVLDPSSAATLTASRGLETAVRLR